LPGKCRDSDLRFHSFPLASLWAIAGCRKRRVRIAPEGLGDFLTASPPTKKATASEDQAGQTGTDDGTGDGSCRGQMISNRARKSDGVKVAKVDNIIGRIKIILKVKCGHPRPQKKLTCVSAVGQPRRIKRKQNGAVNTDRECSK